MKDKMKGLVGVNTSKNIPILNRLAEMGLTMYDQDGIRNVQKEFNVGYTGVILNAKRHHEILQLIVDKNREIADLKAQIQGMKVAKAQGLDPICELQPWEMTTEEFRRCMAAEFGHLRHETIADFVLRSSK